MINVMRKGRSIAYLLLLSFVFAVSAASAESVMEDDLGMAGEEAILFGDIPSVFSASKYEQKVTEAPSSVSIITADEIKKYGYRDFGELLESIRGFYVTNDRNYDYIGVRGFGQPSDYNNRVLVLVDGIRTNDNVYDAPAIGQDFAINIDLIDRVEVVRGPSSSLYGTSAFFAVINVITKRGRDYKGLETSMEYGSNNTYQPRITYGKKLSSGLEMMISGSYFESDGDDALDYNETYLSDQTFAGENVRDWYWWYLFDDDAGDYGNATARDLDYSRGKQLFAKFTFSDFTLTGTYNYYKKGIPTAPWETIFNDSRMFSVDESYHLDLKYDHIYANDLSLLARINYNYYDYYGDYPYEDDLSLDPPESVINDDQARGQWIYGETQLTKTVMEKHTITGGAAFQANLQQDQSTIFVPKPVNWVGFDFYDERNSFNYAFFLQDDYDITDKLILNAGIRYDHFDTFGSATNPRAALIYSPREDMVFKAVYGEAFRAPNVYELYYHDGSNTQKPSETLKPEEIKTYELIYEQYISEHSRGTLVGFYYEMEELIGITTDPADDLLVFVNSDDIKAKGVEFEFETKLDNGIGGRFSYTYQETENEGTGRVLTNSPEHLAKLNLTFPLWQDKIFLSVEEQYTSKRRTDFLETEENEDPADRLPGFPTDHYADEHFLTNVNLFCEKIWKNLDVSAGVYNFFDEDYSDPGAAEHFQDVIKQDGRTFRLKMTYLF